MNASLDARMNIAIRTELDPIDRAHKSESRARAVLIAIGEQWTRLELAGFEPTDEERNLRAHLIQHWRQTAHALNQALEQPVQSSCRD